MIKYTSIFTVLVNTLLSTCQIVAQNIDFQFLNGTNIDAVSHQTYDYDRDGDPDIVAIHSTSVKGKTVLQLVWLENDAQHRFLTKREVPLGELPPFASSFFIKDYNRDGLSDILIASKANNQTYGTLTFYSRQRKGEFLKKEFNPAFDINLIIHTDVNNDGYIDLFVAGFSKGVSPGIDHRYGRTQELKLLMGSVDGFEEKSIPTEGQGVDKICAGDLNSDNFSDLIYSTPKGLHCLMNNKKGSFTKGRDVPIPNADQLVNLQIQDLNYDTHNEIVYMTPSMGYLKFQYVNPSKNYEIADLSIKVDFPEAINAEAFFMDVNNDKKVDIVCKHSNTVYFYLQLAEMIFSQKKVTPVYEYKEIELIDLDLDRDLDILCFSTLYYNKSTFWYENTSGKYHCHSIFLDVKGYCAYRFMDIDNDEDQDIILMCSDIDNTLVLYKNEGDGVFKNYYFHCKTKAYRIELLDVNQDGRLDPIICTTNGELAWLKNTGRFEVWSTTVIDSNINTPKSLFVQDFNKDNKKDIIVGCYGDSKLIYYHNIGAGKFEKSYLDLDFPKPKKIQAADFNQDGNLDLVALSEDSSALMRVYLNQSGGRFIKSFGLTGAFGKDFCIMDANDDQKPDIFYTASGQKFSSSSYSDPLILQVLLLINENNTFKKQVASISKQEVQLINIFDYNADNKLDVIYTNVQDTYRKLIVTVATNDNGKLTPVVENTFPEVFHSAQGGFIETFTSQGKGYSEAVMVNRIPFCVTYLKVKKP